MKLFGSAQGVDPRGQQWEIEDFVEYFRKERGNWGNSRKFNAVIDAFDQFSRLQGQPVNQESAIRMVKAGNDLKKACEEYAKSRRGARTGSGKERLAAVDCLAMYCEDLNLDQARDMRVVRELEGRTWRQAGKFKTAEITLDEGNVRTVGAAVSQRMKVEHGGKTGFFTEQFQLESAETLARRFIDGIGPDRHPGMKQVLENKFSDFSNAIGRFKAPNEIYANDLEMLEYLENLGPEDTEKKRQVRELIDGNTLAAVGIVRRYQKGLEKLGADAGNREKERLMDEIINNSGVVTEDWREFFNDKKAVLMELPAVEEIKSEPVNQYRYMKAELMRIKNGIDRDTAAGREQIEAIEQALADRDFMQDCIKTGKAAGASGIAGDNSRMELDQGNELSSRNIATSRIAELLGIGNIAAHSEKMVVRSGDKVMTGCFMERAAGIDINSKSERTQRMVDQMEVRRTPGFNKDMTTIEIFDYLCAQNDRHSGNMFYQLSEPDKDGKRDIIGLQGIDNDLAFGEKEQMSRTQGLLRDMTFIDRELAEKIRGLDRDTLEYALGDLLPAKQIDKMMERVEKFRDHMEKNMVTIEPDGWDLEEYRLGQEVDKNNERAVKYLKGLENFDKSINGVSMAMSGLLKLNRVSNINDLSHKDIYIKEAVMLAKAEREKAPKVAISFEEMKAQERAAIPGRERRNIMGVKTEQQLARMREEVNKRAMKARTAEKPSEETRKKAPGMGKADKG